MQDGKKWEEVITDQGKKKWGDKMQDKKNGETRRQTKKMGR